MLIDKINPDGAYIEKYEAKFRARAKAGDPVISVIDGIECVLPEEEIREIKARWAENSRKDAKIEADKRALKDSAHAKLASIGLTPEELKAILKG